MDGVDRVGHLDDPRNLENQRRMWKLQRLAWAVILLLVMAGLAGFFGSGPLSRVTAGEPGDALRVEYERFWRVKSPMPLRLFLRAPAGAEEVRVQIDRAYLKDARVEHAVPEPGRVELSDDRLTFVFPSSGGGELEVVLHLHFERPGAMRGRIVYAERELSLRQFVFP